MAYLQTLERPARCLLIINPVAGMLPSKTGMFDVISAVSKAGCIPTTLLTEGAGDAAEFARRYGPESSFIVCCGGDGTLNETVSGVMTAERRPPIGYVPCGTTNDMAKTLELPTGNVRKAVKYVLGGDNVHQDVGRFGDDRFFMYVASFGAFTKSSYSTPRWKKNLFGHMAYIVDGLLSVSEIRPWHLRVRWEGGELEDDFAFGSVTNSTSIAGILRLDRGLVSLNDGKFEVMLIRHPKSALDMERIVDAFVCLASDKPIRKPDGVPMVYFFRTDRIVFSAEEPMPWTTDGEFGGSPREVTVENLHGAVELLRHA